MKVTVDIPDEEIATMVKELVANRLADRIIVSRYDDGAFYRKMIKEAVREVIRSDIDNLSDRAVTAASKSIENRAIKKLLDKLEDNK